MSNNDGLNPDPVLDALNGGIQSNNSATDNDAAARLVESYGTPDEENPNARDLIRYSPGFGWLIWDGKRWVADTESLRVQELAKELARAFTALCLESDGDGREKRIKAALGFENKLHMKAACDLARSDPRIFIEADKFDADPYALNCENGIINLREGLLEPHDRKAYCTKIAPVVFNEDARHDAVDIVLGTIADTCGADMPDFLARAFGMCLTGDVSADVLFLLQGDGGAGKTTLLEAMAGLLGDYAIKLPFESFCLSKAGRAGGGASPDLMKLRGARLAIAEEGDRTATLDAGRIKELTGGGTVTARNLYSTFTTFRASHHLWLCSNFEPHADADDTGVWRRMVEVRFQPIPPEKRDPSIRADLLNDPRAREALFAWAVKGCGDWFERGGGRDGLAIPASIDTLTASYRRKMDSFGQWFDEGLEAGTLMLGAYETATNAALRDSYEKWTADNGAVPIGARRFFDALERRGLTGKATNCGRRWQGVGMRSTY
jgi:putative DNA primase/helicase